MMNKNAIDVMQWQVVGVPCGRLCNRPAVPSIHETFKFKNNPLPT